MSDGLKFYQKHNIPGLEHCDATIKFTMVMNNMFDALNAKFPFQGVRPGSKNVQVRNMYKCTTHACLFGFFSLILCFYVVIF